MPTAHTNTVLGQASYANCTYQHCTGSGQLCQLHIPTLYRARPVMPTAHTSIVLSQASYTNCTYQHCTEPGQLCQLHIPTLYWVRPVMPTAHTNTVQQAMPLGNITQKLTFYYCHFLLLLATTFNINTSR